MSKDGFVEQFKTVGDFQDAVNDLINEHRKAKNKNLGVMFRVVVPPNDATIYKEGSQGPYQLVNGIRVGDYTFDQTLEWVQPDLSAGLSFSKSFSHLKSTWKMLRKHAKGKNQAGPANIASWILESRELPNGMRFVKDPKNNNHYFLAVTKRMHVSKLESNLKTISHAMNIMRDLTL
jgi:hypothetical protein